MTRSMSLFQQAAQLNNKGINDLLCGNQESAMQSMGASIKLMKRALSSKAHDADHASLETSPSHITERICETTTKTVEIPCMESSDTIVFNRVILIPDRVEDNTLDGESDMDIFTVAIIFNVALVHHFRGDATSIAKAEKLYNMAIGLLKGRSNFLRVHTAVIVRLACIANLSQIQYSRGDYVSARHGLNQVSCLVRDSSSSSYDAILEEPGIQGLLMNVLLLKAPTVARAA